ncbi:MAG: hypothetical protein HRT87_04500 [Legionellales bacterium]|nr:hypothetical protein [Legionellales bacterium]
MKYKIKKHLPIGKYESLDVKLFLNRDPRVKIQILDISSYISNRWSWRDLISNWLILSIVITIVLAFIIKWYALPGLYFIIRYSIFFYKANKEYNQGVVERDKIFGNEILRYTKK